MRKHVKEEILSIVLQLEQVETPLKELSEADFYDDMLILLEEMQESAISIGTEAEKTEGAESPFIKIIENYCEQLWRCGSETIKENRNQWIEQISFLRRKIYSVLVNDIRETLEIVFLPYKASMWDSMESVWLVAKEEENCECFVIPIPYYDKNEDCSLGNKHYEAEDMPDYVPTVYYEDYDFVKRRPDVIYIHNPYDGQNFVTSVDYSFYSEVLRLCTKMLVYIPYFVSHPNYPRIMFDLDGLKNVDCIVAQSKQTEARYRLLSDPEISEKVVTLGNPKFDKVLSVPQDKEGIPEEWKDKIQGKKVLFFNTTIAGLLEKRGRYIEKLKQMFAYLNSREEIVVLWRPHPLMKETLQSMCPELTGEYMELYHKFIADAKGIYDCTPDIYNAVRIADAYCGDGSSLVYLFGVLGKPIFIHNANVLNAADEYKEQSIVTQSIVATESDIYFAASNFNGLYKFNTAKKEREFLGSFPEETPNQIMMSRKAILHNNTIYFVPFMAKHIYTYNITTKLFDKIALADTEQVKYVSAVAQGDNLYMIPAFKGYYACFNMRTKEIRYSDELSPEAEGKAFRVVPHLFPSTVYAEGKIWATCSQSTCVHEIDPETLTVCKHEIEVPDSVGLSAITYYKGYFWFTALKKHRVIRWEKSTNEIKIYDKFKYKNKEILLDAHTFYGFYEYNGKLILFANSGKFIIEIDEEGLLQSYMELGDECRHSDPTKSHTFPKFSDACEVNKKLYIFPGRGGQVVELDGTLRAVATHSMMLKDESKEYLCEMAGPYLGEYGDILSWRYKEEYFCGIREFVDMITGDKKDISEMQKKHYENIACNLDGTCGKKIHDYIMGKIK